jgi:uncharacterized protein (DUF433 family)
MMAAAVNVIAAFTEEQASRLTGISPRQLRYWDRIGLFSPSLGHEDRSRPYSRLYSFRDLVSLKVLNQLRNEHKVLLKHLREVKEELADLGENAWSKATLYVLARRVVVYNPETGSLEEAVSKQGVLGIPLQVVTGDMKARVDAMRERPPEVLGKVEKRRGLVHSQPVIAGTRIPVRSVKAFADAGYSVEQILAEYPTLTEADVRAALQHDLAA